MNNREKIIVLADFIKMKEKKETIALACVTNNGIKCLIEKHAQSFIVSVKWRVGTFLRDADTFVSLRRHFLREFKGCDFYTFTQIIEPKRNGIVCGDCLHITEECAGFHEITEKPCTRFKLNIQNGKNTII